MKKIGNLEVIFGELKSLDKNNNIKTSYGLRIDSDFGDRNREEVLKDTIRDLKELTRKLEKLVQKRENFSKNEDIQEEK